MEAQHHNRKLHFQSNTAQSPLASTAESTSSTTPSSSEIPANAPYSSNAAITCLAIFAGIIFFALYLTYITLHKSNDEDDQDDGNHQTDQSTTPSPLPKGLSISAIRSLPVYTYYRTDATYQNDCPVCLAEFDDSEKVKLLPSCKHVFHPECIDTWLVCNVSCPVCRSTRLFDDKDCSCSCSSMDVESGGCLCVGEGMEDEGVSELGGRSTAANDDTCTDTAASRLRRITTSLSNIAGRVSSALKRTGSF